MDFDSMRPFNDEEVAQHWQLIAQHPSFNVACLSLGISIPETIDSVASFQALAKEVVGHILERSTRSFSYTGLDNLVECESYLFVSNHRDIFLDSALLGYIFLKHGWATPQMAVGDNLLKDPFVNALMRSNKCFAVSRSGGGKSLYALSSYIAQRRSAGHSIWIAQKGGRSKDGHDFTDLKLIKMLYLSQLRGKKSFADHIRELRIVPVSVSYEWDPCDLMKAKELYLRSPEGGSNYAKAPGEDIESMKKGITEPKGKIALVIGTPLEGMLETPELVAAKIDKQI